MIHELSKRNQRSMIDVFAKAPVGEISEDGLIVLQIELLPLKNRIPRLAL